VERRTGVGGINVGVIAGVAGFPIPTASNLLVPIWSMPSTSASGAKVARFVLDHQAAFRGTLVLDVVGVTLWMVFGGAVWLRLRRASGSDTLATSLFGVAFTGMILLLMAGFTTALVLAYRVPKPATANLLYDMTFGLLAMSGMPAIVALTAYASVVLATKRLPRRTAELAILTATGHVLLLASLPLPGRPTCLDTYIQLEAYYVVCLWPRCRCWLNLGASRSSTCYVMGSDRSGSWWTCFRSASRWCPSTYAS
jgi:hypothetical protein